MDAIQAWQEKTVWLFHSLGGQNIMMRSLYSGVSGLKVHQTKMDVIGNNISNVNTVGFKGSNVNFSDVFYQTTQNATGPNAATGTAGTNAMQIGLGSSVAGITANIAGQGGSQRTDNPFDVMINGENFFIVNNGGSNYFTKAGAFKIDADGNLATEYGCYVMGWQVGPDGKIVQDAVSPLRVMSAENSLSEPEKTTDCNISGNITRDGEDVAGEGKGKIVTVAFYDSIGASYTARLLIKEQQTAAGPPAAYSNTNYEVSLTDILDANDNSIFVNKDANGVYTASGVTGVSFGGTTYGVTIDAGGTGYSLTPSGGLPRVEFNALSGKFTSTVVSGGQTPAAGSEVMGLVLGDFLPAVPQPPTGPTATFSDITIDFSKITNYQKGSQATLEGNKGKPDGTGKGRKVGEMNGISIGSDGKIFGSYDNGDKKLLGQIAVASFANPSGLEAVGNNMFAATQNSGDFDGIGKDPTVGGGKLQTGVLEMSNVDLSSEFTSMITTQRGFQANSRIITTSDSMLEELINLKR